MRRSIDMGSSMCEESGGEKERKEAGALRVVLLCHQGLDASDRLHWLLRLLLLLGGFHFGCWYVVHYGKNPLIRWIHQLVSSGGLILLSLNYQHKGTKTTVTLLAHMSHHPMMRSTLAYSLSSSSPTRTNGLLRCPLCAPSATWLHKNFTHATFTKEDLRTISQISTYLKTLVWSNIYRWLEQCKKFEFSR